MYQILVHDGFSVSITVLGNGFSIQFSCIFSLNDFSDFPVQLFSYMTVPHDVSRCFSLWFSCIISPHVLTIRMIFKYFTIFLYDCTTHCVLNVSPFDFFYMIHLYNYLTCFLNMIFMYNFPTWFFCTFILQAMHLLSFVCLSISLSTNLSIYLCICRSVYPFSTPSYFAVQLPHQHSFVLTSPFLSACQSGGRLRV